MANTYSQIHLHIVFAVKFRQSLISKIWRKRLFKYIIGITHNRGHKVIAINGVEDHVHLLIGYRPSDPLPELLRAIKGNSSKWINSERLTRVVFRWQLGYGVFAVSMHELKKVIRYIMNQEVHHSKKMFLEEYKELMKCEGISFDPDHIFEKLE